MLTLEDGLSGPLETLSVDNVLLITLQVLNLKLGNLTSNPGGRGEEEPRRVSGNVDVVNIDGGELATAVVVHRYIVADLRPDANSENPGPAISSVRCEPIRLILAKVNHMG